MSEEKDFDPESMDLPPSREFEEAAGLLAYGASPRKPPARVKAELMASLRPQPARSFAAFRWVIAAGAVAAVAALLLIPRLFRNRAQSEFVAIRGDVTVDGHAVSSGASLAPGQIISVPADGEAVVNIDGRAGFRLSRGARASISRDGDGIRVRLAKGWILSAVKTGTPYTVAAEHAEASALGTDFMVKEENGWAQVCICHGRLRLSGFSEATIASAHHYAISQPAFPVASAEGQKGHTDDEISSLRTLLGFSPSK